MKTSVAEQVRDYAGYVDTMVAECTVEDIVALPAGQPQNQLVPRRSWFPTARRGLSAALGAAIAILLVVGLTTWLFARSGTDSPPVVTQDTTPTSVISTAPETTLDTPEPTESSSPWIGFTSADGLPVGITTAVAIDRDGSVWASVADPETQLGPCRLARFDNPGWTTFSSGPILETGCVKFLLPAPGGGVIAAVLYPVGGEFEEEPITELRIVEFDGVDWVDHTTVHGLPSLFAPVGVALRDGTVVIADNRAGPPDDLGLTLLTYDGAEWDVSLAGAVSRGVHWGTAWTGVAIDNNGDAWITDGDSGVVRLSVEGPTRIDLGMVPCDCAVWITAAPNGDIWATDGPNLYRYDGSTWAVFQSGEVLTPPGSNSEEDQAATYALGFATGAGEFWIVESTSASVFRDGVWVTVDRQEMSGLPGTFGHRFNGAVVQGLDGSTWVLAPDGKPHRFADGEWTMVSPSGVTLAVDNPAQVAVAADGTAWFATEHGVASFHPRATGNPADN